MGDLSPFAAHGHGAAGGTSDEVAAQRQQQISGVEGSGFDLARGDRERGAGAGPSEAGRRGSAGGGEDDGEMEATGEVGCLGFDSWK